MLGRITPLDGTHHLEGSISSARNRNNNNNNNGSKYTGSNSPKSNNNKHHSQFRYDDFILNETQKVSPSTFNSYGLRKNRIISVNEGANDSIINNNNNIMTDQQNSNNNNNNLHGHGNNNNNKIVLGGFLQAMP